MKTTKRILALLLVLAAMTSALSACGGSGDALSKEDYEAAVTKLGEELTSVQTDAATLDPSDVDGAKKVLDDMKKPFSDFIDLVPPKDYEDAHEKMKSGCTAMIEYIDTVSGLLEETDETKLAEGAEKMQTALMTAMTDLSEAATMMQ
ncbi:MAG: hypothetical protein HFF17_08930 [Oscillospiraceae bacterium]|nr:hypothetical protein [Oscillospiraceae bacterium]